MLRNTTFHQKTFEIFLLQVTFMNMNGFVHCIYKYIHTYTHTYVYVQQQIFINTCMYIYILSLSLYLSVYVLMYPLFYVSIYLPTHLHSKISESCYIQLYVIFQLLFPATSPGELLLYSYENSSVNPYSIPLLLQILVLNNDLLQVSGNRSCA